eukprot:TRINITY_DN29544_c0_g1_i9.p1 TRINITY_DN29544_c0_g1~~TRINITY_DN29544_c0_g1_i9.p1  ORF type:complete len:100 (-),score=1.20 TRINITY_DN29544_c0_g1_i9:179-478(-)
MLEQDFFYEIIIKRTKTYLRLFVSESLQVLLQNSFHGKEYLNHIKSIFWMIDLQPIRTDENCSLMVVEERKEQQWIFCVLFLPNSSMFLVQPATIRLQV